MCARMQFHFIVLYSDTLYRQYTIITQQGFPLFTFFYYPKYFQVCTLCTYQVYKQYKKKPNKSIVLPKKKNTRYFIRHKGSVLVYMRRRNFISQFKQENYELNQVTYSILQNKKTTEPVCSYNTHSNIHYYTHMLLYSTLTKKPQIYFFFCFAD